jgi:hypothetical protein
MKNKYINLFLALGVIGLAILSAVLYERYAELSAVVNRGNADQTCLNAAQADTVRMSVVTVSQSDGFYNIKAEYPQFDCVDPVFNQKISGLVNGKIDSFKKEAKDNFDARNATMPAGQPAMQNPEQPFDFIATMTSAQLSPRYESFMIDIYYFSGGAHGIDQVYAFNYDLANKKEIAIGDFLGSPAALDKLAAMSKDQVAAQLQSNGLQADESLAKMIQDGTKAAPDNYRNFTFGYGKLTVYFEQYQAAPGAYGTLVVDFFKNDLTRNAISTNYLD